MGKFFLIFVVFFSSLTSLQGQGWSKVGTGSAALAATGPIYTICMDNHGNIYAAGEILDDSSGCSVYKWDGISWNELGYGSRAASSWPINAVFADTSGNLYASAASQSSGAPAQFYVAKWDGSSWNQLGTGSDALYASDEVNAIAMDKEGNLYAAGNFQEDSAEGGYGYVAKWDGTSWSEVGTGANRLKANSAISSIFVDTSGNIYAGGYFTDGARNDTGNIYVAKWDGTSWSELGTGIFPQDSIFTYEIFTITGDVSGNVYTAGLFHNDTDWSYVDKWDGSAWSEVGSGSHGLHANNAIASLCSDINGNIYAAGYFTDTTVSIAGPFGGTINPYYVAKWDGTDWSKLGSGDSALNANSDILPLYTDASGNIYAGGDFQDATILDTCHYFYPDSTYIPYHPSYVAKYNATTTTVLSIDNSLKVNVFPNPTSDELNVTGVLQSTNYRLLTVTGMAVSSGVLHSGSNTIVTKHIVSGVYVLELTDLDGGRNMVRVVKD